MQQQRASTMSTDRRIVDVGDAVDDVVVVRRTGTSDRRSASTASRPASARSRRRDCCRRTTLRACARDRGRAGRRAPIANSRCVPRKTTLPAAPAAIASTCDRATCDRDDARQPRRRASARGALDRRLSGLTSCTRAGAPAGGASARVAAAARPTSSPGFAVELRARRDGTARRCPRPSPSASARRIALVTATRSPRLSAIAFSHRVARASSGSLHDDDEVRGVADHRARPCPASDRCSP